MSYTTFDPGKGSRVKVGEAHGDTFVRYVKNSHYCVKYQGYGIQADVLLRISERPTIKMIKLITPTGTTLVASVDDWIAEGVLDNLGHGDQVFLPVKAMQKIA